MLWRIALFCLAFATVPAAAQDLRFFTIGTGEVSGGYYAAASAICDAVNRTGAGRVRCSPDPTVGSIYNIHALRSGQVDFALVQSDLQRAAFEGTGVFQAQGPMSDLRSVMSLYPETLTIVARRASGIARFEDLRGKRIDVGHPASGRRVTADRVLRVLGLAPDDFSELAELPASIAVDSLCSGRTDATILIVGHPNATVARAIRDCDAVILTLPAAQLDLLISESADLQRAVIPGSTYPEMTGDVVSVAVTATLVTRSATADDLLTTLISAALNNAAVIGRAAPVLADLNRPATRSLGLVAPLHPGAVKAFGAIAVDP